MGGGILQLVAYGAQDVYLTGNPQITFFKVIYRRHTNYAVESIKQTLNGTVNFGNRVTVQITRNGDLIHRIWLRFHFTVTDTTYLLQPFYGLKLLKNIELEIGGQRVDKHYGEWMYIWNELSLPEGKKEGYYRLVGGNEKNQAMLITADTTLYVPLEFWFCRNIGLALPLIALQYHEVKLNIEFSTFTSILANNEGDTIYNYDTKILLNGNYDIGSGIVSPSQTMSKTKFQAEMWVDYIFLDTAERLKFAQISHEYLIEQLQHTGTDYITNTSVITGHKINYNHPVKELVWVLRPDGKTENNFINWNNFTINNIQNDYKSENPIETAHLQLNGNSRFLERKGSYFSFVQPYQHHTNVPKTTKGINIYSFSFNPEDQQPSGTLNMSRIDTASLLLKASVVGTLYVYGTNYNVLRIMSGMGGLAFSN